MKMKRDNITTTRAKALPLDGMITVAVGLVMITVTLFWMSMAEAAEAEGQEFKRDVTGGFVMVKADDPWQPAGFDEALLLRAIYTDIAPVIDGLTDEPAWTGAEGLTVPLTWGEVNEATLKAVYTDEDIYLQVSWADPSKDDQYHPWVWDESQGRYVEGPQVEDGLLVSIEGGCDWDPSLLSGTTYDFDGWLWLAGRTNPIGQAVDIDGSVRWSEKRGFKQYPSRYEEPIWDLKIVDQRKDILTAPWQGLERHYKRSTPKQETFVRYRPDGKQTSVFAEQVPAPQGPVATTSDEADSAIQKVAAVEPTDVVAMIPQYRPVKLEGDAGEVKAKGQWSEGRWRVEFKRKRVTPANTSSDSTFLRTTQFSLHVFDHTEDVAKASESARLLLEFVPDESSTPDVLTTQNTP
jgi:hypothetical protein